MPSEVICNESIDNVFLLQNLRSSGNVSFKEGTEISVMTETVPNQEVVSVELFFDFEVSMVVESGEASLLGNGLSPSIEGEEYLPIKAILQDRVVNVGSFLLEDHGGRNVFEGLSCAICDYIVSRFAEVSIRWPGAGDASEATLVLSIGYESVSFTMSPDLAKLFLIRT